jgi:hypothetical protein
VWDSAQIQIGSYVTVEAVSTCSKAAPAPSSSHHRRGGGGEASTPSRPEGLAQALPLEALHLSHTNPRSICDVLRACLGQQTPISGGGLISSRSDHHGHRRWRGSHRTRSRVPDRASLSRMIVVRRSFCATATSAGLDGADLIRRCWPAQAVSQPVRVHGG